MKQEMIGCLWHQLDHMQIICTLLQTDNHASTHLTASFTGQPGNSMIKPIWILMQQEMMGLQWHHLHHTQIVCTSLQRDNHASTSSLNFLQAGCSS